MMKSSHIKIKLMTAACAGLIVAAASSSALGQLRDRIGGGLKATKALTLSDEEVIGMADQACEYMDAQGAIPPDSDPYAQRLAALTRGLENEDGLALNFKVYRVDELNAFAMANGCVRVYTGLLDLYTDDEVRGVIGHEIGHVKLGHSKKKMQVALATEAGRDLAAAEGGTTGAIAASELGGIAEAVVNAQFSQKEERAADQYGYEFMLRHSFDPEALATGLEKLPGEGGLVSSHPGSAQRAERIRKMIK